MNKEEYFMAVFQLIKMGHWITDQVSIELKEFGITEPQYNVLRILRGCQGKPITVQEIQNDMVQRSSNVTRIIDKLVDKQLVLRQECPTNRRKMDISITSLGQERLKELDKRVHQFHQPMFARLSAEEIKTLTKLILKLKGEKQR